MNTSKDIESREDIEQLIRKFYDRVKVDDTIGIIFTEVVKMDWDHHIPLIVDFWETILLDHPVYTRNAMEVHYTLNRKWPLKPIHFQRWLELFYSTLDELFDGPVCRLAKKRAQGIAGLMQHKMSTENGI